VRACLTIAVSMFLLAWTPPAEAAARARIDWSEVAVRDGADAKRVAKTLTSLLKKAGRHADWGKGKSQVRLKARVAKLEWQEQEGVVRLELAVIGRVESGPEVRSRIRVGGKPSDRAKIEREGLRIVAEGLVTRLAEIVRRR
jgi:hypothetical protein